MNNKILSKFSKKRILWIILILTPIISGLIIAAVTGTGLFRLDAYATSWNDEIGYLRAVRIIRTQGIATGVQSYNEVASDIPAYGAYTIITYIPYVVMSFITGISYHNFMYLCNILIIIIANTVFILLVRPNKEQTCWLILFSSLSLVYERYVWSGMSEAMHVAFLIVILACFIWLFSEKEKNRKKELAVFICCTLLILLFGMIRSFNYIWIFVPVYYVIKKKSNKKVKAATVLTMLAMVALSYIFYRYLSAHWSAKYFSDTSTTQNLNNYLTLIKNGELIRIIKNLVWANINAFSTVIKKVMTGKFVGVVVTTFYLHEIALLIQTVKLGMSGKKKDMALPLLCLIFGFLIYEANILLYDINQCHRMMLSFVVMSGYLICILCDIKIKAARQVAEVILVTAALCMNTSAFKLPQKNEAVDMEQLEEEISELFSCDEDDAWANTIAKNSTSGNKYITIALPLYMNTSTCTNSYLENAVSNDEIKSKYIMLTYENELNELCTEKYDIIYQNYGYTIYRTR